MIFFKNHTQCFFFGCTRSINKYCTRHFEYRTYTRVNLNDIYIDCKSIRVYLRGLERGQIYKPNLITLFNCVGKIKKMHTKT